jgi:peptidoglycan hydrolase-like protein with peptidoglycan-binding domain
MNTTKNLLLILSLALSCVTLLAQNTQQDTLKLYTDKYGNKVTEIAVPAEYETTQIVRKVFDSGYCCTDWVEIEQNCVPKSEYTISIIQTILKQKGYYDRYIDNSTNPETKAAIAKFKQDNGLPFDSTLDSPTLKLLGLAW